MVITKKDNEEEQRLHYKSADDLIWLLLCSVSVEEFIQFFIQFFTQFFIFCREETKRETIIDFLLTHAEQVSCRITKCRRDRKGKARN